MTLNEYTGDDMDKSLDDFVEKFGLEKYRPPVTELFLNYAQEKCLYQCHKRQNEVSRCLFGRKFYLRRLLKKMENEGYLFFGDRSPGYQYSNIPDDEYVEIPPEIHELMLVTHFWRCDPGVSLEIALDGTREQKEAAIFSMSNLNYWGYWDWKKEKAPHLTIDPNEDRVHSLYIHINKVNGKVYVGITKDVGARWYGNGIGYKGSPVFYKAIEKYGWDGFDHIILKNNFTRNEAEMAEIELISKLKSNNPEFGYNIEAGGAGSYRTSFIKDNRRRTVWDRTREKYGFPYACLSISNRQFLTWYMWAYYDPRVADYYEDITNRTWIFRPLRTEQRKFGETAYDTL